MNAKEIAAKGGRDMYTLKDTRDDLILDMEECTPVKLDLKVFPWEVTGLITNVDTDTFMMECHDAPILIKDILYYRLA